MTSLLKSLAVILTCISFKQICTTPVNMYSTCRFLFSIQFNTPFKIVSAHMRRANQWVERKRENLEKNHLAHPKAELDCLTCVQCGARTHTICRIRRLSKTAVTHQRISETRAGRVEKNTNFHIRQTHVGDTSKARLARAGYAWCTSGARR